MSIHDKRLRTEIDNVIKRNLSNGYVPTANEVIGELSRYLINNNLSIPSYKFSARSKTFTAAELDGARSAVSQDLDILYNSLVDLYQLTEEQVEKFSVEKKKHDYRLAALESKLTSLVSRYSTSGYASGYKNSFSDMEEIDLVKTTADIDIVHHEATLKRLNDIPYKDFAVAVSAGKLVVTQNGDINKYLDNDGVVWQGIVEKPEQSQTTLTISIDAKSVRDINKIEIEAPLLKKCGISIYTSVDGDRWNREYTGEMGGRCTTNFSSVLRYIRLVLDKTEADKLVLGKYLYYFIIDSIRLDTVNYELESEVISTPISAGTNVNKVSLSAVTSMPPATSVEYYVAANEPVPYWIPISSLEESNKKYPTVVAFNTMETDQRLSIDIPDGVSNDAYELKNLSVNGQRLFAIGEIGNTEITDYKLYKGVNAWKVETLDITLSGPQTQAVFIQNQASIRELYVPILVDKPGLIINEETCTQSAVRKYSTTIYREGGDTVIKEMVGSSHPVTIYLNGNVLYKGTPSGGTTVTYPFRKGTNLLEVIVNISASVVSLDLNLAVFSIGSRICANKDPMESVSLFNLRYNTNNRYDVYSLYQVGNGYMIIVKDPNLKIRYDFVYSRVVQPIKEILFKAVLRREHASINATPRLISYETRFI